HGLLRFGPVAQPNLCFGATLKIKQARRHTDLTTKLMNFHICHIRQRGHPSYYHRCAAVTDYRDIRFSYRPNSNQWSGSLHTHHITANKLTAATAALTNSTVARLVLRRSITRWSDVR